MKIFLRREGGQIPTYCPQGTIDTNELPSEEARLVADAFEPEMLKKISNLKTSIPEGFKYYIRFQREDHSIEEEFRLQEQQLEPKLREALNLLMKRIQGSY